MNYGEIAQQLAELIRKHLSDEEFEALIDTMSDRTTDAILFRALVKLRPLPSEGV